MPARPCNLTTLPPESGDPGIVTKLRELSRLRYGRPRAEVEAEILERAKRAVVLPPVPPTPATPPLTGTPPVRTIP